MIPNESADEIEEANEANIHDRRKVEDAKKEEAADKIQTLKDAGKTDVAEALRITWHIQTGDDRFDPDA